MFVKHFTTTAQCVQHLKKNRYTLAVTSSHKKGPKDINLYESTFTQNRLAVWFGNEAKDVTDEVVETSDMRIQIPMGGVVESLNLGTSTGIILSYVSYQRLKYIYSHNKVRFKPRGLTSIKMRSWDDFIDMQRSR